MVNAYDADSYWSKYKSQLDAIEKYTITRENGQITVTQKPSGNMGYTITGSPTESGGIDVTTDEEVRDGSQF